MLRGHLIQAAKDASEIYAFVDPFHEDAAQEGVFLRVEKQEIIQMVFKTQTPIFKAEFNRESRVLVVG